MLDSIFLPDSPGVAEFRSEYLPGAGFDPLQLLSAVAVATEQVGLIATVSTTYSFPWDVARRLATLDFLSHGRAGWNIVTTAEPAVAGNFGDQPHPPAADRYERAGEFVEVVLALWDGWAEDAAVRSQQTGPWADPAKMHPPRHHGQFFDVAGFLPFPRSPQGHPFLAQAGSSPPGVTLAARFADAVFTRWTSRPGPKYRAELRSQAAGFGRDPDQVRVLPGLSFLLAGSEPKPPPSRPSSRRRPAVNSAGATWPTWPGWISPPSIPTRRSRPACFRTPPKTSFGASIYQLAAEEPGPRSAPWPRSCRRCPAGSISPAPRRAWPS